MFYPIDDNSLYHFILGMIMLFPMAIFHIRRSVRTKLYSIAFFIPVIIEVFQIFIPDRTFDLTDILVTYAGSLVSYMFSFGVPKRKPLKF